MPTVIASYSDKREEGQNASERKPRDVSTPIKIHAPAIYKIMQTLSAERDRTPYSCAEADALSKLLEKHGSIDLSYIRLSVANQDGLRWKPCKNCSEWLEPVTTTGPRGVQTTWQYKLRLPTGDKVQSVPNDYDKDFPPHRSAAK